MAENRSTLLEGTNRSAYTDYSQTLPFSSPALSRFPCCQNITFANALHSAIMTLISRSDTISRDQNLSSLKRRPLASTPARNPSPAHNRALGVVTHPQRSGCHLSTANVSTAADCQFSEPLSRGKPAGTLNQESAQNRLGTDMKLAVGGHFE